jgi:hypothetical protein
LVLPEGWSKEDVWGDITYKHADGREQKEDPESKPKGIIALANAIPDMGALSSLNLASNSIGGYVKNGGFNATPEGRVSSSFSKRSRQLLSFTLFSRPSRYR